MSKRKLEMRLVISLLVIGLLVVGLVLLATRLPHGHSICQTPLCISAAYEIVNSIDPNVNPCEDFFNFACGNSIRKGREAKLASIKGEIKNDLDKLMEGKIYAHDSYLVRKQKKLFQVCMNETLSEEDSLEVFRKLLSDLNGWPTLVGSRWNSTLFDWETVSYKLKHYGLLYVSFLDFGIDPDPMNTSRYLLHIKEPFVDIPEEEHKTPYVNFMTASLITLGAERALAKKEMWEVYEFTTKLYHVTVENDWDNGNITEDFKARRFTVKDFQKQNNRTDWRRLISQILEPVVLGEDDLVLFPKLGFTDALFDLLHSTPKRVQANYIFWNLYGSLVHFFPSRFRQLEQNYNCQTDPSLSPKGRIDFCRRIVRLSFDVVPTDMLYAEQKTEDLKKSVENLVKNIKAEFASLLQNTKWIDVISGNRALEKIDSIRGVIGINYDLKRDNYSTSVNEDNDCLLNLYLANRKALTDAMYARINTFTYTDQVNKLANSVNAAYSPEQNIIVLHVGILHEDIFHPNQLNYRNYGMLGSIIGHEITHAFSEGGVHWTNETEIKYKEVVKCLLDEVDNFEVPSTALKMNGTRTLDENIADIVGVKASYNAYRKLVVKNGGEPRLAGLDYTPDQLFWISSVSHYCYKVEDKQIGRILRRDNHALNVFRAINPLRNNKDFASAFKCAIGSKMNPVAKCNVFGS